MKRKPLITWFPFRFALVIAPLVAAWPQRAQAALAYWDSNGTVAGAGTTPTGTWGTSTFWNATAAGDTTAPVAWLSGDTAIFSAGTDATTAYAVTLSGTQTINGLTVEEGTPTISGGTALAINAAATPFIITGNANISSVISGTAFGIAKTGAGTLTLSGVNTYTGDTAVNAGILRATTSVSALGAGTLSLGGGTLQLAHTAALNFARNTSVTANSTITADRTTSAATSLTHTLGTLTIAGQTLNISRGTNITGAGIGGVAFGAVTLNGNATFSLGASSLLTTTTVTGTARNLTFNGSGAANIGGIIATTTGTLNVNGGTVTLVTANTFTGAVNVDGTGIIVAPGNNGAAGDPTALGAGEKFVNLTNGGTIRITSNSNPTSTNVKKFNFGTGGGTLDINSGVTLTLDDNTGATAQLQGSGSLTKIGAGTLQLGYIGQAAGGFSGFTGNILVNAGSLLTGHPNALGDLIGTTTISSGSALGVAAGPTNPLFVAENITLSGTGVTSTGALLNNQPTPATFTGTVTLAADTSFGGTGAGSLTVNGNIGGGAFSLTKVGTGRLILGGTNAYTGITNVSSGSLSLTGSLAANTGLTVAAGATFSMGSGAANPLTTISALNLGAGTGTANLVFDLGTNTANSDRLVTSAPATTANTIGLNLIPLAPIGVATTYDLISAPSGLSGATYALNAGAGGYIYTLNTPTDSLVQVTATPTPGAGGLYWQGALNTSWSALSATGAATNWTTDAAGTLNAGYNPTIGNTLFFSAANAVGTNFATTLDANYSVNDVQFNASPAGVTAVSVGAGAVVSGSLTLTPPSSSTGLSVAANAGAVTISAPIVLGAPQTWGADGTGANGSSLTVSGAITGSGANALTINKLVTLSVAAGTSSTYSGATTVPNSAILASGAGNSFSPNSAVTVSGTGILRLNGFNNTILSLTGDGTVQNNSAATAATLTAGDSNNLTFSGILQNGGVAALGLTKTGTGTLTLSNANTHTGNTIVTNGTLNIGGTARITGNNTASRLQLLPSVAGTSSIVNYTSSATSTFFSINGANVTGTASVLNQTAGVIQISPNATTDTQSVVQSTGSYGVYNISGGVFRDSTGISGGSRFTVTNQGTASATNGTITGVRVGIVNVSGTGFIDHRDAEWWLNYSLGQINVTDSGRIDHTGSNNPFAIFMDTTVVGGSYGVLNVAGTGAQVITGAQPVRFGNGTNGSGNSGFVNLAAGTLSTGTIGTINLPAAPSATNFIYYNYAGGTLRATGTLATGWSPASGASATVINTIYGPIDNTGTANDFAGGLTVDTNGNAVTLPATQPLLAATGVGVTQANLSFAGGSGYIGTPSVVFSRPAAATGVAAAGYAIVTGGAVTGIVITAPGVYAPGEIPTITLLGGFAAGAGTATTVTSSALNTPNTSGGLTKTGVGTLTITGPVGGSSHLAGGNVTVTGGVLNAGFTPTGIGAVSVNSGATLNLYDGATTTMAINGLTLAGGSSLGFNLNAPGVNDVLSLAGTPGVSGPVSVNFNNLGGLATGTYDLINVTAGALNAGNYTLGSAPSGFNYVFTTPNANQTLRLTTSALNRVYWQGDAGGSWSAAGPNTNWASDDAGLTDPGTLPASTDTLVFSSSSATGPAFVTTLDGSRTADSLRFTANPAGVTAVSIGEGSGGTLTLAPFGANNGIAVDANAGAISITAPVTAGAAQTWEVVGGGASGSSLSVAGNVAFTNSITKSGAGALSLSGTNTGAGGVNLAGGTLNLNSSTALGTGTFTIAAGTTIDASTSPIVNANANVQNWNGNFTFAGTNNLDLGTGAVTLGANLQLTASTASANTLTIGGIIGDAGNARGLTKAGTGTVILKGANTYSGATAISAGALSLTGSLTGTAIATSGTGILSQSSSGVISGASTVTQGSTGMSVLGGSNDYTGPTNITAGIIRITNGSALGTTAAGTTSAAGSTLEIDGTGGAVVVGAETLTINGGGVTLPTPNLGALRNIAGDNTYGGTVTMTGQARINSDSGTLTLNNATAVAAANLILVVGGAGNVTISGAIATGTGGVSKGDGTGTLTLTGANTYTGGTSVASGFLRLAGSMAATAVSASGGTIQMGSSTALTGANTLTLTGTGTFDLNGFSTSVGGMTSAVATSTITNSSTSTGASTATALGTPSGTGVYVDALNTQAAGAIAALITDGPTRETQITINNNLGGPSFTNAANTFSGGIVLLHNPTLNGGTRLSPGVAVAGAYGSGPIIVGQAPTDKAGIYFASATSFANPIICNTALGNDRVGIRVDAAVTLSGQLTANLAPVTFATNGTATLTATGKITGPEGLVLAPNPYDLTAARALTVVLNNAAGTNDYAGNTTVNLNPLVLKSTTLTLGAVDQIPNGSGKGNVIVNSNGTGIGTLNLATFSETINGLSGNGVVDITGGTPVLTLGDNSATASFSGVIRNTAGSLSLVKTSGGTQTLAVGGTYSYSGTTSVDGGSLIVNASLASPVTVNSTGTLGGIGPVTSTVTVAAGGTLAPGSNGIGTLITGAASLASATSTLAIEVDGAAADQLLSTGAIALDGPLTVSLLGAGFTAPAYIIAQGTSLTGTFSSVPVGYSVTYTPTEAILTRSPATPYAAWINAFSSIPVAERDPGDDPDQDGASNLLEFAINGNPGDRTNNGLIAHLVQDSSLPVGDELTLVVAIRDSAVFADGPSGTQTASISGITYSVQGSLNVNDFPISPVSVVGGASNTAPIATGLPSLAGTDWEYRVFKLNASESLPGRGFLRLSVTQP